MATQSEKNEGTGFVKILVSSLDTLMKNRHYLAFLLLP